MLARLFIFECNIIKDSGNKDMHRRLKGFEVARVKLV